MTDFAQPTFIERAIADGYAEITGEGKSERIRYIPANHSESWADPEEKVRAEFWAELLYKYEYDPKRIHFEVNVPRRTPNDYADIVIYKDDDVKDPYFVFECKRADVSDAEFAQSIEQACGNRASLGAPFAGAVSGLSRRLLRFDKFPPGERDRNHLTDIPKRYGKPPVWRFYRKCTAKILLQFHAKNCGPRFASATRLCGKELAVVRLPPLVNSARSFLSNIVTKKTWTVKMENPMPSSVVTEKPRLNSPAGFVSYTITKRNEGRTYSLTRSTSSRPSWLSCVEHLEGISLDRTELDTKGVAFEEFMGSFFKGDFGQYFTPRELIAFAVEVLNPERKQLVLDPACGSGGFLLYALDHVRHEADRKKVPGTIEDFRFWHDFAEKNLFGIEVNDELARVAKMNMIIHDDGHTNIVMPKLFTKNSGLVAGAFDLVLTNPPFGSARKRQEPHAPQGATPAKRTPTYHTEWLRCTTPSVARTHTAPCTKHQAR